MKAAFRAPLVARVWPFEDMVRRPTRKHELSYVASLKVQERVGIVVCFLGAALMAVDKVIASLVNPGNAFGIAVFWVVRLLIVSITLLRLCRPKADKVYALHFALSICGAADLVARAWSSDPDVNTPGIVIRRLFIMQYLLVGGFFCFRRHGQYALAMFGAAALALLPSLAHLPADIARVLYMPYVAATLVLICLLAAWDMTGYRSFMAEQECKDLKDIKIAALTQISHVIKNKLNYVEGFLSEWRERIGAVRDARIDDAARGDGPIGTAGDMDDPEDEFGTMLFCVRASLGALTSIDVLRSIKAGLYETAMPATQVDRWVADYAGNHGLAASKTVPVALVHFDVRIIALVLEDAWSNAFKYGDTAKARPEISARLLDGQTIEVSIANRQMPGKRLQEDTDALFGRGSKGSQATGLSDGFGLADARQAAEAAGGTVSLREHAVGDAWFTAFAVTLPALTFAVSLPESSSDCASVEGETATEPARGGGGAASRYRVDVRVHSAADDRRAAPLPRSHARAGDEAADSRDPFPRGLTVLACDDERVQRRVLEKIFLGKLGASEASVVLGANLDEVQSVIRKAVTLKADIVILDQNLLHGGVVGTQLADDLRAAGFGGFVVLRTGSTAEGLRRLQVWPSVDLAVGKEEKNMDVIAQIKRAYLGTMPATPGTSALVPPVAVAEAERAVA